MKSQNPAGSWSRHPRRGWRTSTPRFALDQRCYVTQFIDKMVLESQLHHTPSTHCLLLLTRKISSRFCWGVDFLKPCNKYVVRDKMAPFKFKSFKFKSFSTIQIQPMQRLRAAWSEFKLCSLHPGPLPARNPYTP